MAIFSGGDPDLARALNTIARRAKKKARFRPMRAGKAGGYSHGTGSLAFELMALKVSKTILFRTRKGPLVKQFKTHRSARRAMQGWRATGATAKYL